MCVPSIAIASHDHVCADNRINHRTETRGRILERQAGHAAGEQEFRSQRPLAMVCIPTIMEHTTAGFTLHVRGLKRDVARERMKEK